MVYCSESYSRFVRPRATHGLSVFGFGLELELASLGPILNLNVCHYLDFQTWPKLELLVWGSNSECPAFKSVFGPKFEFIVNLIWG